MKLIFDRDKVDDKNLEDFHKKGVKLGFKKQVQVSGDFKKKEVVVEAEKKKSESSEMWPSDNQFLSQFMGQLQGVHCTGAARNSS